MNFEFESITKIIHLFFKIKIIKFNLFTHNIILTLFFHKSYSLLLKILKCLLKTLKFMQKIKKSKIIILLLFNKKKTKNNLFKKAKKMM